MKLEAPGPLLELLPADAPFSAEQRAWLNGFFAALLSRPPRTPATESLAAPTLHVLHASQTGTAEGLARKLVKAAKARGVAAHARALASVTADELAGLGCVLIIASTCGAGGPPDACSGWPESMATLKADALAGLGYAVLALGDRNYAGFCAFGRLVDERMAALGARRLADCVEVDGAVDAPYTAWLQSLWQVLPAAAPKTVEADRAAPLARADEPDESDDDVAEPYRRDHPFGAELLAHRRLNRDGSDKDTRHVVLSLAGSGLHYEPGDALGVWPRNPGARVEALLAAAGLAGTATVIVDGVPLSLRETLLGRREIGRVTTGVLLRCLKRAEPGAIDPQLAALSAPERTPQLQAFLDGLDAADLFGRATMPRLAAQALVDVLAPLAPRLYSISSSLSVHPGEVHLTVGVVSIAAAQHERYGIASQFLARAEMLGDTVPVYVHRNTRFRLPQDPGVPVVMIGPGTGIAPFRAFLEERHARKLTGRAWLFYGDRRRACDFLYRDELESFLAAGTLTRLDAAFSRDAGPKEYVQDRMLAAGAELWSWIADGAAIYVCGDAARMAGDVDLALRKIIVTHGKRSAATAQLELRHMGTTGRYLRDVY